MTFAKRPFRTAVLAILLAALCFSLAPIGQAASVSDFTDVSKSAWYYDAVAYVTGKGLFNGMTETTFAPTGTMTRGMFITVLGRYAGVDPNDWLQGTINARTTMHSGAGSNTSTVATLNGGAVITMLGKSGDWYKIKSASVTGFVPVSAVTPRYHSFSDVSCGSYYAGYAVWGYEKGIVTGMGNAGVFAPNSNVTREQLCSFLNRYATSAKLTLTKNTAAVTFKDQSSISSWATTDVQAMQRSGVINGNTAGNFLPRNPATRAEAAAMFQRFDAACHGGVPTPTPNPSTKPSPTPSPTPTPSTPPTPSDPDDTPATLIDGTVNVPATVIRVGLMAETQNYHTSVRTLTMENLSGGGFTFGTMNSNRTFVSQKESTSSPTITVTTDGRTMTVKDLNGATVYTFTDAMAIHPTGSHSLTRLRDDDGDTTDDYRYYGDFELRQAVGRSGYMTVINCVDIEDYAKGVIPYEFSVSWPMETLKVAAIASRTHIMSTVNSSAYRNYGMDVVANDGTQLYRGRGITYNESYFGPSDEAVEATAGLYLTYNNALCVTSFSACNGGRIKSAAEVFGVSYPYLIAKEDPYEQAAVKDVGSSYTALVNASHKVGLSQWGAYAMAKYYSKDYQTILGFYFPGTHLQYGNY